MAPDVPAASDLVIPAATTVPMLKRLLEEQGCTTDGSKAILMARLQMNYLGWIETDGIQEDLVAKYFTNGITKASLQAECQAAHVSDVGTIPELRLRLVAAACQRTDHADTDTDTDTNTSTEKQTEMETAAREKKSGRAVVEKEGEKEKMKRRTQSKKTRARTRTQTQTRTRSQQQHEAQEKDDDGASNSSGSLEDVVLDIPSVAVPLPVTPVQMLPPLLWSPDQSEFQCQSQPQPPASQSRSRSRSRPHSQPPTHSRSPATYPAESSSSSSSDTGTKPEPQPQPKSPSQTQSQQSREPEMRKRVSFSSSLSPPKLVIVDEKDKDKDKNNDDIVIINYQVHLGDAVVRLMTLIRELRHEASANGAQLETINSVTASYLRLVLATL